MTPTPRIVKTNLYYALIIGLFFCLTSCNQGEVYYQYRLIPASQWQKSAVLGFVTDSLNVIPSKQYDLYIEIINNNLYKYQNIWLIIDQNIESRTMKSDTIEIKIADQYGKWYGSGTGGLHQISYTYKQGLSLDSTQQYLIYLKQYMTDDPLKGIEKVGIKIQETI